VTNDVHKNFKRTSLFYGEENQARDGIVKKRVYAELDKSLSRPLHSQSRCKRALALAWHGKNPKPRPKPEK
jgi:hypothetical protein